MSAAVLSPALMIMPSGYEEHANDFQMLDGSTSSSNDEESEFSTGSPVDEEDCTSIDDGVVDAGDNNNTIIDNNNNNNNVTSDDMSLPSLSDVPLFGNEEEEEEPVIDNNADDNNNDDDNDNDDNWLTAMEITTETEEETTTTEAETTTNNNNNTNSINYGGLYNMGNTCYMNSALQMLASCEDLQEKLLEHEPQNETALELYTEIKELLTKLKNGETISPTKFKQILDAKSPLFLGYRQQDSHEFLTTLIDLLDEDYLKKVEEDKEETKEKEDTQMDTTTVEVEKKEEEEEEADTDQQQQQLEEELVQDMMTEEEEAVESQQEEVVEEEEEKQPLLVAGAPQSPAARRASLPSSPEKSPTRRRKIRGLPQIESSSPMRKIQSYSDLQPNDIEYLLHGSSNNDKKRSSETLISSSSTSSPQCKLVGGRAILTNNTTYCCPSDVVVEDDGNNNDVSAVARLPEEAANNESQDNQEEEKEEEETKPYSPIDELFTTEIRVCLTCDSCKYTRSHNETYKHLSLEIGDDNSTSTNSSVEEGLRNFFKDEKRDIKCEKCFGETATQTMKVVKVPKYFLIHLKRFIVNYSADWSSVTYRKNQSAVDFTTELSITDNNSTSSSVLGEYLADDVSIPLVNNTNTSTTTSPCCDNNNNNNDTTSTPTYSIRSIVNHIGSSASCGHYTADSLRLLQNQQQQDDDDASSASTDDDECKSREWLRFNDSNVSRINNNDALTGHSKRTAYMIMYELSQ